MCIQQELFCRQEKITSKKIEKISVILVSFIYLFTFTGCGGKRIDTVGFEKVDAPKWVLKSNGAFKDGEERVFYGIGSASGIENYSLLRTASENRARNEVAKVFEVYMASLMREDAASTISERFNSSSEEQHVEQAIKAVVAVTLSGVKIVDHWEQPAKGVIFSLAKLNLDEFGENLERMKELNSHVKDYIRENAKKLHEELLKEEKKLQER